ncbi:hypothetical protein TRFO_19227 [Tritrichomonas foetus]|uniref:Uncharacterized protein n=1 Tax=Tritrichomonas foetus TaxID=1144522 RepID=A0A1J4KJF3_9EUKA|nr:hypothetical protein TRFO_19227 [Tritrichomonas foetus]|eukprot:OHT11347.1 hypothetical protein TRFO_19227 [Tritrichomonas foetus]
MNPIKPEPKFNKVIYYSHLKLIERYILLLTITFFGVYFADRKMTILVILLIPLFYLLNRFPPYHCINTPKAINAIANSLPISPQEPANCISQVLSLVWPHIFMQERVDYFKEQLQWVLDNNKVPYFDSIALKSMKLGNMAPQITQILLPKTPEAPDDSIMLQMQAIYYPSFELSGLCTPSANVPAFNITFTDLTVMCDVYIMLEFTPDPYIPNMPFWTALDFLLVKPPQVSGFNLTLFQSSNLINKDSIKAHMSDIFSKMIWNFCGIPNGFVWERIGGVWKKARVYGSHGMERVSLHHGEILRYSRIKTGAIDMCRKLCIAEPLTLQTISYQDESSSTHYLEILSKFTSNKSIETLNKVADEFSTEAPSKDELRAFLLLSYNYITELIAKKGKMMLNDEKKKKKEEKSPQKTQSEVDKFIAPIYGYVNFLALQQKVNWEIAEELKLEQKRKKLENQLVTFHQKIFKMSTS